MLIHFLSSISPIFLPIGCALSWVFTNNFFYMYTAIATFFFGEYFNFLLKKWISVIFANYQFIHRPYFNAPCGFLLNPINNGAISYGYPSGHCQTIGVFSALMICYLLNNNVKNANNKDLWNYFRKLFNVGMEPL